MKHFLIFIPEKLLFLNMLFIFGNSITNCLLAIHKLRMDKCDKWGCGEREI